MKLKQGILPFIAVAILFSAGTGCSRKPAPSADGAAAGATVAAEQAADMIYAGGDIITVNDAQPMAEAVAVKDGKILAVGSLADVEKAHRGTATQLVDLAGRTLAPGFVDAHAHVLSFGAQAVGANLLAAPDGKADTMDDVVAAL